MQYEPRKGCGKPMALAGLACVSLLLIRCGPLRGVQPSAWPMPWTPTPTVGRATATPVPATRTSASDLPASPAHAPESYVTMTEQNLHDVQVIAEVSTGLIRSLNWSPDSRGLALSTLEQGEVVVQFREVPELSETWTLTGLNMYGLAFSSQGHLLVGSHHSLGTLWVVDAHRGQLLAEVDDSLTCSGGRFVAFSQDDDHVLSGFSRGGIDPHSWVYSWNLASAECEGELLDELGWMMDLAVSPDGRWLATSFIKVPPNRSSRTLLLDLRAQIVKCEFPFGIAVAFSDDGERLAILGREQSAIATIDDCGTSLRRLVGNAFAVDSGLGLAAVKAGGKVQLWSLSDDNLLHELQWVDRYPAATLAFSPDRRFLLGAVPGGGATSGLLTLWGVPVAPGE